MTSGPVPIDAEAMPGRDAPVRSWEGRAAAGANWASGGSTSGTCGKCTAGQLRDELERTRREAGARQQPFTGNRRRSKKGCGGDGAQAGRNRVAPTGSDRLGDASARVLKEDNPLGRESGTRAAAIGNTEPWRCFPLPS